MLNKNKLPELVSFDEDLYSVFIKNDKLNNSNLVKSIKTLKKEYGNIFPKIVNNIANIFTK